MNNINELLLKQAAAWYARLRAPDCSPVERQEFQRWLERDAAHARAYEAAVRTAERVTQQIRSDPHLRELAAAALARPASHRFGSLLRVHWRKAAMFLVSVGVAGLMAAHMREISGPAAGTASYVNDHPRQQRIALEDGSVLHLDIDSRVNVTMEADARKLELIKGRAYFEVAHDDARPFSVTAADTRTVALGTRFEVALLSQQVNISLAEGSVAITPALRGAAGNTAWREVLMPGERLQVDVQQNHRARHRVNAQEIAGWSTGRLVFNGVPLAKVLEEINRYATVKVHLGDAALADIPVGGSFVAGGDSIEFVETLAAVLPLRSVRAGANEIVLFQRYETRSP